jgi:hypothetical protein
MPTGYTAEVQDGEITSFKKFALQCARAFGACITLRDSPMSDDIPEFKVDPYHSKMIHSTKEKIAEIESMTPEQCDEAAHKEFLKREEDLKESIAKDALEYQRYKKMLAKAKRWQPPTSEHKGLKDFMVKQLEESIEFDCMYSSKSYPTKPDWPVPKSGQEWRAEQLSSLNRSLLYHIKHHDEEVERVANRNQWVKQLKESLKEY